MSLYYDMVKEQSLLMEEKEYDENSLDSAEKNGRFMHQFQVQFSLALNKAHRLNETIDFDLKTVGFFGRGADLVVFNFSYQYNPETLDLSIRKLSADLDKYNKTYSLDGKGLPTSFQVYRDLKHMKNLEENNAIKTTIKGIVEDQELLLNELGLTYPQFSSQLDLFGDCLSSELNKLLMQNDLYEKGFFVEIEIPSTSHGSITCHFGYTFDPFQMKIEHQFILAKTGTASIRFPGDALLNLKQMEEALNLEIRKQNARLIADHNPTSDMKNRHRL